MQQNRVGDVTPPTLPMGHEHQALWRSWLSGEVGLIKAWTLWPTQCSSNHATQLKQVHQSNRVSNKKETQNLKV